MGVIQRQGIKSSIVNYFGVIVGAISTLFIYPLDWELYGSIQYWISSAIILAPILRQGSTALVNKYYPYFKENKIEGFLRFILLTTSFSILSISLIIFLVALVFWDSSFFQNTIHQSKNICFVYLLSILIIYSNIFQQQASNARRIVIPEIVNKLGLKFTIIALVLLGYYNFLNQQQAAIVLLIFYLLSIFLMVIYLKQLNFLSVKRFSLKNIDPKTRKSIFKYWAFGGFNYLGVILAYKIDAFMIGTIVNKSSVGYYSVFLFLTNVLIIPMTSISQISGPIISEHFEKNQISKIDSIYKKSASSLLALGILLFLIFWINIFHVFEIMTNGEDLIPFVSILLFLGISKIFDLMTSVNNLIIIYSPWYQYNLVFLAIMALLNLTLNILFIDLYGIVGASIATLISIFIFNTIKTLFIYYKLKIHPITEKTLYLLLLLAIGITVGFFTREFIILNNIFTAMINTVIIIAIYVPIVYKLKASPELNSILDNLYSKISKK